MCSKKVLVMSLLLILVLGACGGGSSGGNPVTPTPAPTQPTAPPLIPAANIIAFGQGQLLSCFFSQCDFQGEARNTGLGCADTVRGTTKFFNTNPVGIVAEDDHAVRPRCGRPHRSPHGGSVMFRS